MGCGAPCTKLYAINTRLPLRNSALSLMAPRPHFPGNFSSEVVKTLEGAFQDVWLLLQAHDSPESDASKDLGIALSRTLVALAAEGITDRHELRRKALVQLALSD